MSMGVDTVDALDRDRYDGQGSSDRSW